MKLQGTATSPNPHNNSTTGSKDNELAEMSENSEAYC
jgi:hypothetical protein